MLRFGSVCSGIEAASVAWGPLGWEAAWLSEIEPFPSAVLKHHYPDVPNLGDMTTLPERILSGEVEAPDLFCGGTPCQAFSVAGLRHSLDDARGNLSLVFVGIANAIDHVRSVRSDAPAIVFWENVPGVLSTKDNAFGCFLGALAGEDDPLIPPGGKWSNAGCVYGPQRAVAWRVLDAQYFGVAQRRRRVFVVASARADFDPAAVLFEFDGLRRDTAPSRQARQTVAGTIEASLGRSRGAGTPTAAVVEQPYEVGNCLTARMHKGINSTVDEVQTPVLQPIPIDMRNAGRDPEKHDEMNRQGVGVGEPGDPAHTITSAFVHGVAQPIALQDVTPREKAQNGKGWNDDGTAYTVDTHATQGVVCLGGLHPNAAITNDQSPTLTSAMGMGGGHIPAVAQPINIYGGNKRSDRPEGGFYVRMGEDTSKTLDAASGLNPTCSQGGTAVMQPIGIFQDSEYGVQQYDSAGTLRAGRIPEHQMVMQPYIGGVDYENNAHTMDQPTGPLLKGSPTGGGRPLPAIATAMQVRRLTPVECERLQGFPDGYTNIKDKCPDGPRYKALGNSWAVPVVAWIGRRIHNSIRVST